MPQDTMQGLTAGHGDPGAQLEEKEKTTTVIINARPYDVVGKEISYTQVVNLAYNNSPPMGPNVMITVSYSRGDRGSGSANSSRHSSNGLAAGDPVAWLASFPRSP